VRQFAGGFDVCIAAGSNEICDLTDNGRLSPVVPTITEVNSHFSTMKTPLMLDTKRMAIYDGSGIRTTFFVKGCPLRCTGAIIPNRFSSGYGRQNFSRRSMQRAAYVHGYVALRAGGDRWKISIGWFRKKQ